MQHENFFLKLQSTTPNKGQNLTLRSIVGVVGTRSNAGAEVEAVGSDDEFGTSFEALIINCNVTSPLLQSADNIVYLVAHVYR